MNGPPERYCLWQKVTAVGLGAALAVGVATLWWVWTDKDLNREGRIK